MREVTIGLAVVAILGAPLHAGLASGPADAPPPPGETAPVGEEPTDDLTPEERAKQLGWEEEEARAEGQAEQDDQESDEGKDEEEEDEPEPDDDDDDFDEDEFILADPELRDRYKQAKGFVIGGAVALGVGGGLAIIGGTILGLESTVDALSAGFLASPGAVATGAVLVSVGAAGFIAGAVLLPIGLVKRGKVRDEAAAKRYKQKQALVVPWFGRRSAGLSLTGRF
jgi:hypothetical protein